MRYADDFVILCRTRAQAEQALAKVRQIMGLLRLQLHPTKTRLVELGLGKEGFTFLGCYLRIVRSRLQGEAVSVPMAIASGNECHSSPHPRSDCAATLGGHEGHPRSDSGTQPDPTRWGGYFRTGNASGKFNRLTVTCISGSCGFWCGGAVNDGGGPAHARSIREWPYLRLVQEHGLYQLLGTIRYPGGAHAA